MAKCDSCGYVDPVGGLLSQEGNRLCSLCRLWTADSVPAVPQAIIFAMNLLRDEMDGLRELIEAKIPDKPKYPEG